MAEWYTLRSQKPMRLNPREGPSPSLATMNWFITAMFATLGLALYNFVLKLSSSKISSLYALPFIGGGAFLVGIVGFFITRFLNIPNLNYSKEGVFYAFLTGFVWALGEIFFFMMFSKNTPLSIGLPLVLGGLTIIGSLLGIIFLKEPITIYKTIGISCLIIGWIFINKA